jgi:hypothetical protein
MADKSPQETAKAEIQGLNRRIKDLEIKLWERFNAKPEPVPMSRSSVEAYIGIAIGIVLAVLPMTWWLRIFLFVVLEWVCVDFSLRSPFTFKWPALIKRALCVVVCSWIAWVAYGNVTDAYTNDEFPKNVRYMLSWGTASGTVIVWPQPNGEGGRIIGNPLSEIVVDGTKIQRYSKKYKLWAVCSHHSGFTDPKDDPVSGSALFDVNNDGTPILMKIPWNDRFRWEVMHGASQTNYALILIPKKLSSASFPTVRDALRQGGVALEYNGGSP